jgi:hypothetical protein
VFSNPLEIAQWLAVCAAISAEEEHFRTTGGHGTCFSVTGSGKYHPEYFSGRVYLKWAACPSAAQAANRAGIAGGLKAVPFKAAF